MLLKTLRQVCFATALCCVLPACSESDPDADAQDGSALPDEISVVVGKSGGRVRVKGASLDIPEGALSKDVTISVKKAGKQVTGTKATAVSDVFEFGPTGTKFTKDVAVSFDTKQREPKAQVYFTKEREPESFEKLASMVKDTQVSAKVRHFSRGFAGIVEDDELDSSVPDSEDAGLADAGTDAWVPDEEPDAGPQGTRITLLSRNSNGAPVSHSWVAFQNGEGAWRALEAVGIGRYEFNVSAPRYGLVAVCANTANTSSSAKFVFAPATSIEQVIEVMGYCHSAASSPTHQISGTLSELSGMAGYRYGHSEHTGDSEFPSEGPATYLIEGLPSGRAVDSALIIHSEDFAVAKGNVTRNLTLTADQTDQDLDYNTGWHDLSSGTFQIINPEMRGLDSMTAELVTGGANQGVELGYAMYGLLGQVSLTFLKFPEGALLPGDRYRFTGRLTEENTYREVTVLTTSSANLTVTRASPFTASLTADRSGASLRPMLHFAHDAAAKEYAFNYQYLAGQNPHLAESRIEAGYFPQDEDNHKFAYPELSGTPGFQSSWVAPSTASVSANASVTKVEAVPGGWLTSRSEVTASLSN